MSREGSIIKQLTKDPYKVYLNTAFLSQLFFTLIVTVNLLYQVYTVKLDPLQLVLVGTVLELTVFLFEIPTGVVSDLKSRKLSIVIGYVLIGVGFLIEGLFPYFSAILLAQIVWGIGYTFTSGARQAWIADEIGEERASEAFVRGAKIENLAQVIAIPLSIAIGYFMVRLPIIIGGICTVGLAIYLMKNMTEENFKLLKREKHLTAWGSMKKSLRQLIVQVKVSVVMRILFLIALFVGFYSEGFDRLWLSHLSEVVNWSSVTPEKLVILTGGIQFVVVLVSFAALHVVNRSSVYQKLTQIYLVLFMASLLIILSLIGFATSTSVIALLGFFVIIQVTRTIMYPLEDIWLNKIIPDSSTRATFFSVKGQADAIGQIGGAPIIGMVATRYTIRTALIVSAILLTPVLFLYRIMLKRKQE
ncbi:MFS transporter [Sporosarcina sp. ZBG7A]|uniref:MFS transporter n=1 Tax=Sporosarcina sp. ZBG7A TaxID=1582223 RepID=UPI00057A3376|nr:MFS transporter [Sporosarcina sp. ZBG7A]